MWASEDRRRGPRTGGAREQLSSSGETAPLLPKPSSDTDEPPVALRARVGQGTGWFLHRDTRSPTRRPASPARPPRRRRRSRAVNRSSSPVATARPRPALAVRGDGSGLRTRATTLLAGAAVVGCSAAAPTRATTTAVDEPAVTPRGVRRRAGPLAAGVRAGPSDPEDAATSSSRRSRRRSRVAAGWERWRPSSRWWWRRARRWSAAQLLIHVRAAREPRPRRPGPRSADVPAPAPGRPARPAVARLFVDTAEPVILDESPPGELRRRWDGPPGRASRCGSTGSPTAVQPTRGARRTRHGDDRRRDDGRLTAAAFEDDDGRERRRQVAIGRV